MCYLDISPSIGGPHTPVQQQVQQYRPLNTTPALYSTLTDAFLDKAHTLDTCKGMKFDAPTNAGYKPYLDTLQATGRTVNTTVADGNFLYRSISKGLIGTEFYHFRVRSVILGFIYMNPQIFEPHIRQVGCPLPIRDYCVAMNKQGVWGTEIEILGVATLLQAPVYTFSEAGKVATSLQPRWLKYSPLQPAMKVISDYDRGVNQLVNMSKPPNFHLELLHFKGSHYDLVIPEKGQFYDLPL